MSSVYNKEAFWTRVEFAASVISRGGNTTRNFDTCFEMNDGDQVIAALARRAKAKPSGKLAQNLYRFITKESAETFYEATKHLSRAELAKSAAEERERSAVAFAKFMEEFRAKQAAQSAAVQAAA